MAAVLALGLAAACAPDEQPARPSPRDAGPGLADDVTVVTAITYREHIAPLFAEHCLRCHVRGGIGLFPLERYSTAVMLAPRIQDALGARRMPPYLADNSGSCATYRHENTLTDTEIALVSTWVATGTQEGDTTIPLPVPPSLPTLDRVDATLDLGMDFFPMGDDGLTDHDEARCFLVAPGITADRFVTGFQVRPGNPAIVHRVVVYEPRALDPIGDAALLEAEDARAGWRCDGGARMAADPVVFWIPGVGATRHPAGTGLRLTAGRPLVLQILYDLTVGGGTDRTLVDLELEATVSLEASLLSIADPTLALAPGMARAEARGTLTAPSVLVWGVLPYMRSRGLDMRIEIADTCLFQTAGWRAHWQQSYWLEVAQPVARDAVGTITCGYDTTGDTDIVRAGEGSGDETCLAYLYTTPR